MKRDLVMMLAGLVEVDVIGMMMIVGMRARYPSCAVSMLHLV